MYDTECAEQTFCQTQGVIGKYLLRYCYPYWYTHSGFCITYYIFASITIYIYFREWLYSFPGVLMMYRLEPDFSYQYVEKPLIFWTFARQKSVVMRSFHHLLKLTMTSSSLVEIHRWLSSWTECLSIGPPPPSPGRGWLHPCGCQS